MVVGSLVLSVSLAACSSSSAPASSVPVPSAATSAATGTPSPSAPTSVISMIAPGNALKVGNLQVTLVATDFGCPEVSSGMFGCPVNRTTHAKLPGSPFTIILSAQGKKIAANGQWWLESATGTRIDAALTSDGSGTWEGDQILCSSASGDNPGAIARSGSQFERTARRYTGTFMLPSKSTTFQLVFATGDRFNLKS